MQARLVAALALIALVAPTAAAGILDTCEAPAGVVTICKSHSGNPQQCPGSGGELLLVSTGAGAVAFADSGSCSFGSRSGLIDASVTEGGATNELRWSSTSGSGDTRDILLVAGGTFVHWYGSANGGCGLDVSDPVAPIPQGPAPAGFVGGHTNCLTAVPLGLPGLNYGALLP